MTSIAEGNTTSSREHGKHLSLNGDKNSKHESENRGSMIKICTGCPKKT